MGRQHRIVSETGCYHVVARGNSQKAVFRQKQDYWAYRHLLGEYGRRHAAQIYHYCLMSNHIHLALRIESLKQLSQMMHDVQRAYSRHRQMQDQVTGQLWQGRFQSYPINDENYFLACGRYIERNPIEGGLTADPGNYPWSSYRFYAYGVKDWIVVASPLYASMGRVPQERQSAYRTFIDNGTGYKCPF